MRTALPIGLLLVFWGCGASAHPWTETPGSLVGVSVEIDGRGVPLYPSPDGADRSYVEARAGASYAVNLANRTGDRLGVLLTVDGLNAISGERDAGRGRLYVLGPWERMTVRGWRTSLSDVRRFNFVDERASYAARSGKANGRMGWIETAVFRERRRYVARPWLEEPTGPPATVMPDADAPAAKAEGAPSASARAYEGGRSYPGTGWGPATEDHAVVVSFEPEAAPAERVTLRYEYRTALLALGVLPRYWPPRDRLLDRERGQGGFAKPPAW
jgi:hypothetical protein